MEQFAASVDKFLTFNDYKILPDKGRISASQAKAKAESEYDIFNKTQRIDSDFDKQIREMLDKWRAMTDELIQWAQRDRGQSVFDSRLYS